MPSQPAFSPKEKTHRSDHEAHVAELQRSRWRVGVAGGRWWLAEHDGTAWCTWDESLAYDPDADVAAERYRLVQWLHGLLGYRSGVLHRDYASASEGRLVFDVIIGS